MKKYISIMLIAIAVAGGSCKKTFLSELAANPDVPSVTSPGLQLSAALAQTATLTSGTTNFRYLLWDNYMSYSTNYQPTTSILLYSITTASFDSFTPLYANITNYNAIITANGGPYLNAIANIMMVYDFQQLVDQYGNVPYSQALQGIGNLTPAYDNQSTIYDNLIKQLDAAITSIQTAPATAAFPAKYDIMFGATTAAGMLKWAQFANTLKLRLAIRQSSNTAIWGSKQAALTTDVQSTASVGYLSSSVEGQVNPVYTATDPYESALDRGYGYTASGAASGDNSVSQGNTYFLNLLVGSGTQAAPNDPRLPQMYKPSTSSLAAGAYITTALGQTSPPQINGTTVKASVMSAFLLSPTKSSPLILGSESLFLQAEACEIGLLTGGTAQAALDYAAGIQASYVEFGLTTAQATAYMTAYAPYPTTTFAAKQQAILTQKYLALFPYEPLETYCEILRTGYPKVPLSVAPGSTATQYVERMLYPLTEYNYNTNNVNAQGTITPYSPKIFWEP